MRSLTFWRLQILKGIEQSKEFFFAPANARPLALLRMGLAILLLTQAFLLRGSIFDFFAHEGLVQSALVDSTRSSFIPTIGLFTGFANLLHFNESSCILAVCWLYSVCVLMFGLGYLNRFSTTSTFFLQWLLTSPSYATAYGFDLVAHAVLFYFLFLPAADAWSVDLLLQKESARASGGARLGLRLLQFQLCLIFLNGGWVKASHRAWWNGEVLWRSLTLPIYRQYNLTELANWPKLVMLAGWFVVLLQLGFAVLIWPRATRKYWLVGSIALNVSLAWFFGLWLFGGLICVLTLTLFGLSPDPTSNLSAGRMGSTSWVEPIEPELILR